MKEELDNLYNIDNKISYQNLLDLEIITTESNELYNYFDELLKLLSSDKSFIRVRGFRLICALAKWDNNNKINDNIEKILNVLDDEKGTAVRQCLSKLNLILIYKIELTDIIEKKLRNLDLSKYKDTMKPLIEKDIYYILNHL